MTIARLYGEAWGACRPGGMVHFGAGMLLAQQVIARVLRVTRTIGVPLLREKVWSKCPHLTKGHEGMLSTVASGMLNFAAGGGFSNTVMGGMGVFILAHWVANRYLFGKWVPVPKCLKKVVADVGQNGDAVQAYFKPLEKLKGGKVHPVYAVTGMEWESVVKCVVNGKVFGDKEVYCVDGDEADTNAVLGFLEGRKTPMVILSNVPLDMEKCPKEAVVCYFFSKQELAYGVQDVMQLGQMPGEAFTQDAKCVEVARKIAAQGIPLTVEELAACPGKTVEEKAFGILRQKNRQPHELIALARDVLEVGYVPPLGVTRPSCLNEYQAGDGKGKRKADVRSTVFSTGYTVDEVKTLAGDTGSDVLVWNMSQMEKGKQINGQMYGHMLDYLWNKKDAVLVAEGAQVPGFLVQFMSLVPPGVKVFVQVSAGVKGVPEFEYKAKEEPKKAETTTTTPQSGGTGT